MIVRRPTFVSALRYRVAIVRRWTTILAAGAAVLLPVTDASAREPERTAHADVARYRVRIEHVRVHSPAIVGNLEGETPDRAVVVVLPPGYDRARGRRYPVVYALHGYSVGAEQWAHDLDVPGSIERAYAAGAPPMIVVFPDGKTVHNGSMYSASPTTGDFETFVAHDLVAWVDAHYRTLPRRESRGLVGHSMGGYGATRIGMRHADVFGALYVMSPCCLAPRPAGSLDEKDAATLAAMTSPTDSARLSWALRTQLAAAAAWSPNPKNPPLYLDLPIKDGAVQPDVLARWAANSPIAFAGQYVGALRRYRAIALDVGTNDWLIDEARQLHATLERYDIAHRYTVYDGDHTNRITARFQQDVMPFFGRNLTAGPAR